MTTTQRFALVRSALLNGGPKMQALSALDELEALVEAADEAPAQTAGAPDGGTCATCGSGWPCPMAGLYPHRKLRAKRAAPVPPEGKDTE